MSEQAKLTITEAAKLAGISRAALYRNYINKGVLSVNRHNKDVFIEFNELLRVFPDLSIPNKENMTKFTGVDIQHDNLERENNLLREQLKHAENREEWLKSQIDELRQQQANLLEDKSKIKRKKFLGLF
jgi:DNA-binding transcriptional MerR regulator